MAGNEDCFGIGQAWQLLGMEVWMKQEAPAEPPSPASVVEPLHEPEEMEMVELEVDNDNETDTHLQQLQEEVKVKLENSARMAALQ